jgi:adenosylmethionine-8-amino-7-oxononanoate aminotransferase
VSGDDSDHLLTLARRHVWPTAAPISSLHQPDGVHIVVGGRGCWVNDASGRRWFDAMAGNCLMNVGYGRDEIAAAASAQMCRLTYAPQFTQAEPTIRLAACVAQSAPDPQSRVFFTCGGSEAVETALKLARKYHRNVGAPGKYKVISRLGSYHGATLACASLGGNATAEADFGPLVPGHVAVTQPYHYGCCHCANEPACTLQCARDVEDAIVAEGPETVSAVIAEPISTARLEVPSREYFALLRQICQRYGVLLILDEIITGWGRTGRWFASEHWDVAPDIITIGKGLTAGYAPIGAVIVRKGIAEVFDGAEDRAFRHMFTFAGHPVSSAVALATREILEREHVLENAARQGTRLHADLSTALRDVPMVAEVRGGVGLMCGVELVRDRTTRASFGAEVRLGERITRHAHAQGLLMRQTGNMIYLVPPLIISDEEIDTLVNRVVAVVRGVADELQSTS